MYVFLLAPLRVQLSPSSQVVDIGGSVSFRCLISGGPIESIQWYKDGVRIPHDHERDHGRERIESHSQSQSASMNIRYRISPRDILQINSVETESGGMYQCFASNQLYTAQDSAHLRLGCKSN